MYLIPLHPIYLLAGVFTLGIGLYYDIFDLLPFSYRLTARQLKAAKFIGAFLMFSVVAIGIYSAFRIGKQ